MNPIPQKKIQLDESSKENDAFAFKPMPKTHVL
jgi:hypothetical protein